jgi:plastocyanin
MRRILPLLFALSLALAACGGNDEKPAASTTSSSSPGASGGGATLKLTAEEPGKPEYKFSKSSLSAKAGKVTIALTLPGGLKNPHGIAIDGNGVDEDGPVTQPGGSSTVTADLKPGTYTFYCPVGNHREEGMKGKLTVQ